MSKTADRTQEGCWRKFVCVSMTVYLLVPNLGMNRGIPGWVFLNPEIPGLENGPRIAIPNCDVLSDHDAKIANNG